MFGKTNAVGIFPKGKITITENATDIDVKNYALADVNVSGGSGGDIKPYLDGTLTSTNMQGATSLKPYRFYDFENLTNLDLTGITEIPEYTAQNATALVNLTFDDETNLLDNTHLLVVQMLK